MKFEQNKKYTTIAIYVLLVLLIAMLCSQLMGHFGVVLIILGNIIGYTTPVIYGVVFAFLLNPMLRSFEEKLLPLIFAKRPLKKGLRRVIGMVLTYIVTFIILSAFIAIVLPQLISSAASIWNNIPSYFKILNTLYNQLIDYLQQYSTSDPVGGDIAGILETLAGQLLTTLRNLLEKTFELISQSLGSLITAATNLTTRIVNLLLGFIASIYILYDREKLFAQINKISVAIFPKKAYTLIYDIAQDINRIFSGFVIGKVIDSLIIGVLCMIGTSILRMPYAVLISVIVGVTNVIPYFGPFIGAIPGILIIFIVDPMKALWFGVFILLLQQLDGNVIGPKILGDTVGLSPLWIIFSIMLFSGLLGVLGMFIGVPLFAIIYSLVKRFISYLLTRKGESVKTKDYASEKNQLIK